MAHNRVLLLITSRTYRAQPFLEAADRLGIEALQAIDMAAELADHWRYPLGVPFQQIETAVNQIVTFAQEKPFDAIIAVDDSGALLAAATSQALGIPHNAPEAAAAARDKYKMRQLLQAASIPCPPFQPFTTADDPHEIAQHVRFPCVVKPLQLSGSRGVIRANNPHELKEAIATLTQLLHRLAPAPQPFLVEQYIPGIEVALEGLLENGRLTTLALFDKPDPLEGPYFEETIYVTPSRLPASLQTAVSHCTAQAAQALGLAIGPVHAELRINEDGPWLIEVAGRSIGGLCSQTLQFGTNASLEELILRQACGLDIATTQRTGQAGGVMMIPIPEAGLLQEVTGIEQAKNIPLIEDIEITAKPNYPLIPLPAGDSYLGFIFAKGPTPAAVEEALRLAHQKLGIKITPHIPLSLKL